MVAYSITALTLYNIIYVSINVGRPDVRSSPHTPHADIESRRAEDICRDSVVPVRFSTFRRTSGIYRIVPIMYKRNIRNVVMLYIIYYVSSHTKLHSAKQRISSASQKSSWVGKGGLSLISPCFFHPILIQASSFVSTHNEGIMY